MTWLDDIRPARGGSCVVSPEAAADLVPRIPADAHKYARGVCELYVGSKDYPGAAVLSACAANKLACGYVIAYTISRARAALRAQSPSIVVRDHASFVEVRHEDGPRRPRAVVVGCGFPSSAARDGLLRELSRACAQGVPSVSERPAAACSPESVARVLERSGCPVLLDGGALDAVGSGDVRALLEKRTGRTTAVITPHLGEAARIAQAMRIDEDLAPVALSQAIAEATSTICMLKGSDVWISTPEGSTYIVDAGTWALAKAGTGDVLAGAVGSLLAYGMMPLEAAVLGAHIHACAGRMAGEGLAFGPTTEDVLDLLPQAAGRFMRRTS